MAKKKKIRIDRLILIIIAGLLVICLAIMGINSIVSLFTSNNSEPAEQESVNNSKGYTYSVVSHEIYNTGLNYDFAIVTLNLSGNLSNASLSDFTTNDDVNLGDVSKYEQYFADNFIELNYDYVTDIKSSKTSEIVKVFVPIVSKSLVLSDGTTKIIVDINTNTKNITIDDSNPEDESFTISFNDGYQISDMEVNGSEYNDNAYIFYCFKLNVENNIDNLTIVSATYNDENGTSYECLDSSYSSLKAGNLINSDLSDSSSGLFIRVLFNETLNKKGTMVVNFSDGTSQNFEVVIK